MTFRRSWRLLSAALVLLPAPGLWGQMGQLLSVAAPRMTMGARKATLSARLSVQLRSGYHVNSSTPSDKYLIPLRLTWNPSSLQVQEVAYPKPQLRTYSFSKKPISVYSDNFDIETRFLVPAGAPLGAAVLTGKLRYQACNDSSCFPPKTVDVRLPVTIRAQ